MMRQLWNDEAGFIVSAELVLIATIVVIGMIVGLTAVRDAVVTELADVAGAIGCLNQSYSYGGVSGHCAATVGSFFSDHLDFCDTCSCSGRTQQCVTVCTPPTQESACANAGG
jgi:Flp pilus assembly pilin Flp